MEMKEFSAQLQAAMAEVAKRNEEAGRGTLLIEGKKGDRIYTPVSTRVEIFRKYFGCEGRLRIVQCDIDETYVTMKAVCEIWLTAPGGWIDVSTPQGHEIRPNGSTACLGWNVVAEGYDREPLRSVNPRRQIPPLQNCETSAYGRALANLGLHGGEYASAEEMLSAMAAAGAEPISDAQRETLQRLIDDTHSDEEAFLAYLGITKLDDLITSRFSEAVQALEKKRKLSKKKPAGSPEAS